LETAVGGRPSQHLDRLRPRRLDWFFCSTALFTAFVVAFELLRAPPAALMQVDSQSYLDFAAERTAGYPLFLRFVEHLPGGLRDLPPIQFGLYAFGALFLCCEFRKLSGSRFASGLLLVLLFSNGQVTRLTFMIMTEALFSCCLMLLLALCCRLVRKPQWQTLGMASLVAGLAALIRPAGYPLVVSLPIIAWWCWRDGLPAGRTVLAAALPYLATVGLGIIAYHAEHGLWRAETFVGRTLLGKAAAIVDANPTENDPKIIRSIAAAVAPDRAVIDRAPTVFDRFRLIVPYYDLWRYGEVYDIVAAQAAIPKRDTAALDRRMEAVSLAVIAAAPAAYLADVALNYGALWWLPDAMTHAQLARFRAFINSLEPLPDLGRYPAWHRDHSDAVIWALHGFMATAFAVSLWWGFDLIASVVRGTPLLPLARVEIVAAILVHASFLLTAAVEAGLPRYAWALWPALSILFVSGVCACSQSCGRHLGRRTAALALSGMRFAMAPDDPSRELMSTEAIVGAGGPQGKSAEGRWPRARARDRGMIGKF
jgi:hypothetical protein